MKRVLLKLSGEALAGEKHTGFDEATCVQVAKQVKEVCDSGVQVGVVIGGGNFWRGRTSENIDRTKSDQIGMLATVMNCIYVSEIFRSVGMKTKVFTPFGRDVYQGCSGRVSGEGCGNLLRRRNRTSVFLYGYHDNPQSH